MLPNRIERVFGANMAAKLHRDLRHELEEVRDDYLHARRLLLWGRIIGLVSLAVAAMTLADRFLALPPPARRILTALALLGIPVFLIVRHGRFIGKKLDMERIALYVEERLKGFDESLVTAVEVKPAELNPFERPLAEELLRRALGQLRKSGIETVVDRRPSALAAGLAVCGFITCLCIAGAMPRNAMRVLLPFDSAKGPTLVRLTMDVSPKSVELPRGGRAEIRAAFSRSIDEKPLLHYVSSSGEERTVEMSWVEGLTCAADLADVQSDGIYRVTAQSLASPDYPVRAYLLPAVQTIRQVCELPAYLRMPPRLSDGGDVKTIRGSRARLTFRFNKPVVKCEANPDAQVALAVKLRGQEAEVAFDVNEDFTYALRLADGEGRANAPGNPYSVHAVPDEPPKVSIVEPGSDTDLPQGKDLDVRAEAYDDLGLAKLQLATRLNGGPEQRADLAVPQGEIAPDRMTGGIKITPESHGLKPGDVLSYYAEAQDTNTLSGPGKARTRRFYIFGAQPPQKPDAPPERQRPLTDAQRKTILDTSSLNESKDPAALQDGAKLVENEMAISRILEELRSEAAQAGDPDAAGLASDAEAKLQQARDELIAQQYSKALGSEEGAFPLLYQIENRLKGVARTASPNAGGDVASSQPPNAAETPGWIDAPERVARVIEAARRLQDIARREVELGSAQAAADANAQPDAPYARAYRAMGADAAVVGTDLEAEAAMSRDAAGFAAAAQRVREAGRQMALAADAVEQQHPAAADAKSRAARQSLSQSLEGMSHTSEEAVAERLKELAQRARHAREMSGEYDKLAEQLRRQLQVERYRGNARNYEAQRKAAESQLASEKRNLDKEVEGLRDAIGKLQRAADALADAGLLDPSARDQAEKALAQADASQEKGANPSPDELLSQKPSAGDPKPSGRTDALQQAENALSRSAAQSASSSTDRLSQAAAQAGQLADQLEQGSMPGEMPGASGHGAGESGDPGHGSNRAHVDLPVFLDAGTRNTALALEEKMALAKQLPELRRADYLRSEALPLARKLQAQLADQARRRNPEKLSLSSGLDDEYPPEFRPAVDDYFRRLSESAVTISRTGADGKSAK